MHEYKIKCLLILTIDVTSRSFDLHCDLYNVLLSRSSAFLCTLCQLRLFNYSKIFMPKNQINWKRPIVRSRSFLIVVIYFLFSNACVTIHTPPTNLGPCTFTIVNIWPGCNNKVSNGTHVNYKITFQILTIQSGDVEQLNTQSLTSNLTTLTITANIPKDATAWKCRINMETTDCTTCAEQSFPGDACQQVTNPDGSVSAAKSTRYGEPRGQVGYIASETIGFAELHIGQNVGGSCNCIVPSH